MTIYSLEILLSQFGTSPLFHVQLKISENSSNCCFLTYIQISQEAKVVCYSYTFKNFPQFVVIHTKALA